MVIGDSSQCKRYDNVVRAMRTGRKTLLLLSLLSVVLSTVHCRSQVYLVHLNESPVVAHTGSVEFASTAPVSNAKLDSTLEEVEIYKNYLEGTHENVLSTMLPGEQYVKLYSYVYTVNGFAVMMTEEQAARLSTHPGVLSVKPDNIVKTMTTHTPDYLELTTRAWPMSGGVESAGEGIVIGLVDTGINPAHPSFAKDTAKPYGPVKSFKGSCEVAKEFPKGSCNGKLIGARHFSAAVEAAGYFNASYHFASPLDGDGHGTHTASTAAGNYGVAVVDNGINFGKASGIAPRARVAMYKCLYRGFGGLFADVVAGIDQAAADGVDILSLSVGPAAPDTTINALYFSIFDLALLGATKAGVLPIQAAGNSGPYAESILSWSPWILSVAAGTTDRVYSVPVTLGSGITLSGGGFAAGTAGSGLYTVKMSTDVNTTGTSGAPNTEIDECQDYKDFSKEEVEGNLLVCSYSSSMAEGFGSTVESVADTVNNLSAAGVIFIADPYLPSIGFDASTVLMPEGLPAVILSSNESDKFMAYYRKSTTLGPHKKFGAKSRLFGGANATYTGAAPAVVYFSSRGPNYNNASFVPADVLKPNVLAPGYNIWAGWSPIGIDDAQFVGSNFALISGTSMATPHIAGIAALVKAMNPTFSPAAIHSALATTAFSIDKKTGAPLQAMNPSSNVNLALGPASAFDMGSGHVDATAALHPGLIFDTGFIDYVKFLCITPTVNSTEVRNGTGIECSKEKFNYQSDLNMPYVSIGVLEGSRTVMRTVTNVDMKEETYTLKLVSPANVTSTVRPSSFSIAPGKTQTLEFNFKAKITSYTSSFGSLHLSGNSGHSVSIPITVTQMTV